MNPKLKSATLYSASALGLSFERPSCLVVPVMRFLVTCVPFFVLVIDVHSGGFGVPDHAAVVFTVPGDRRIFVREPSQVTGELSPPYALTIKGSNWSPASTNSNPGADPTGFREEFFKWYERDIPLMARMGMNVARLYYDMGTDSRATAVLDAFYRYGIKVVLPVTSPYYNDPANSNNIPLVVNAFKNHPAILAWGVGNEWDINYYYDTFTNLRNAAQFTEQCAQIVASIDTNHPVISFYGDPHIAISDYYRYHYLDPATAPWQPLDGSINFTIVVVSNWVPSVKIWGLQLYRNASFTDALFQWAQVSTKPVFVSEFGADSFDHRILAENQAMQRNFNVGLWNETFFNLSSERTSGIASGVLGFEFIDEWYKGGDPGIHNYSTEVNYGQPDGNPGYNDEKWFGWLSIFREPKQVCTSFQQLFALNGQNAIPLVTNPILTASSGNAAIFLLNGKTVLFRGGGDEGARGLNIAILDEHTGLRMKEYRHFDTWWYRYDGVYKQAVADYLNAIPNGAILMVAVADNSGFSNSAIDQPIYQALERIGSTEISSAPATSWAMIAMKGSGKLAETSTMDPIIATPQLSPDANAGRRNLPIQVVSPIMQGRQQSNGNFKITFKSQDGVVYKVDYSDSLNGAAWQLAQRGIIAGGPATDWVDDGSFTGGNLSLHRLYRVIAIDQVSR